MNSARQVDEQIQMMKAAGWSNQAIVWNTAKLTIGWPYVFGAWGAYCTVEERKKRYSSAHPTIYSACQVLRDKNKKPNCDGCKWFPGGERVRCYDCRGFTDWCLKQVGIDLVGEGATSQWNTASNWSAKGTVKDGIPADTLVCLFYPDKNSPSKMAHTGLGLNGETVECSNGVEYHEKMASKWTHWAVPAGINVGPVPPTPTPPAPEPTPKGYAIVTGTRVALRTAPTTQASIIMRIDTGNQVKLEEPPPEEWDYVSYQGKTGWMMKKFLKEGE